MIRGTGDADVDVDTFADDEEPGVDADAPDEGEEEDAIETDEPAPIEVVGADQSAPTGKSTLVMFGHQDLLVLCNDFGTLFPLVRGGTGNIAGLVTRLSDMRVVTASFDDMMIVESDSICT